MTPATNPRRKNAIERLSMTSLERNKNSTDHFCREKSFPPLQKLIQGFFARKICDKERPGLKSRLFVDLRGKKHFCPKSHDIVTRKQSRYSSSDPTFGERSNLRNTK